MFRQKELFKASSVTALAAESARAERLDKSFPHECCPEKWGHLGWTTPKSKEQGYRYKEIISQSHVPIELLCGALSFLPKKRKSYTTREYLLDTVCRSRDDDTTILRPHFETYCRFYEKAIYGSEEFNHEEFYNFQHVYNYLTKSLVRMKVEETRITKSFIIFNTSTTI